MGLLVVAHLLKKEDSHKLELSKNGLENCLHGSLFSSNYEMYSK